uniref:Smoothelin-like 1 n=1 Tax=Astyanax mexicanus TaxID=7994 RepID=A0A3B1KI17_ASTMX
MDNSTVASGTEESKNKNVAEESPEEESDAGRNSEPTSMTSKSKGETNEENGEEEPHPHAGSSEEKTEVTTECNHAQDTEGEKDLNKDREEETLTEEEKKECGSRKDTHIERGKSTHKDESKKEKEVTETGDNKLAEEEEGKTKAKSDSVKEQPCEKDKNMKEDEKENEKDKASKCSVQETADQKTKAKEKEEIKDKPEKVKSKGGATPSSSSLRALASSRPRSARPSARREAMAKFQQDQTPVVRNFKVQKMSVGVSGGASIKQKILQWCSNKTRDYEGVSIENFSSSWSDGLAFCALVHRFFPTAFDFSTLKASEREKNFTLAFSTAETLADCCPLLDVSDMLLMGKKPDPFSVFTYVQSLCQHLSKIERERKEREKADDAKNKGETDEQGETEGQEPSEDRQQVKRTGEEQEEEKAEGEGEGDPAEGKVGPEQEEEGPKMETDQNDNVVISENKINDYL